MNVSSRPARRSVGVLVAVSLLLAACGGGDDRSRNVETIIGVACTKKGATKTVSKLNYVCGVGAKGNVWFAVVGKLTTKGAKACKPLGKFDAAQTRVCGSVKKKNVWVKVAPLPVAVSGVGETTVSATESTAVSSETSTVPADSTTVPTTPVVSSTTTPPATQDAAGELNEVARALAPAPQPKTVEEFLELLVPRPVEAQAARRVPTSIKVEGGATTIANGSGFAVPLSVTVLDQNDEPLAAEGNTIVATISRPDASLTNAVELTDARGVATFADLRVDGEAGPAVVTVAADFGASVQIPVDVTPGRAVKLSIQNHPTQITVSETFSTDPTVSLLDKDGNQVRTAGVEIVATIYKTPLARVKSDDMGVATFAGLTIGAQLTRPEGASTNIVYSVPSDPSIASGSVDVRLGPGAPNGLKVVTAPSPDARAGFPLERQPAVRIVDANGNPVAMKGVRVVADFICNQSCGAGGSSETVTTDGNGVAKFAKLTMRGMAGAFIVRFTASDYEAGFEAGQVSGYVNVNAGEAASIRVIESTSIFSSGVNVGSAFLLHLVDAWGNAVPGFNGTLAVTANRDIGILTRGELKFQDGELRIRDLTIKGKTGPLRITFQSDGFVSDPIEVSVVPGSPAKFEILTPAGTITAGNTFGNPLAVRLLDSDDNPIEAPNLQVAFSSSAGTGSREIGLTNEQGIASFLPNPIERAGKVTLLYSDPAGKIDSAQDVLTVVPAAANSTRLVTAGSVAEQSGVTFRSKPAVQLIDRFGNAVAQSNVTISAGGVLGPCSGTLTVTNGTAQTNANGVALFDAMALKGFACQHVIGFSPPGGATGAQLTVSLSAGPASALGIVTQPSGAVNGKALTTQPVVQLKDSSGNDASIENVVVSTTLDGETFSAKTDSRGTATFKDVTAKGTVGDRTLTFTSTGLVSVTSSIFGMAPGDVAQVVPAKSSITISQEGQIPSVSLKDASGNTIASNPSVALSFTSVSGTTSWIMGSSAAASSNGRADFPNTKISSTSTVATLRYSISGRSIAANVAVTFAQGPAAGQVGPSGGVIFAAPVPNTNVAVRPYSANYFGVPIEVTKGGRFGEVAPAGWAGSTSDPVYKWSDFAYAPDLVAESAGFSGFTTAEILSGIGKLTMAQHTGQSAVEVAASLDKFGFNDWLLPVSADMGLIIDGVKSGILRDVGLASGGKYWTSSAVVAPIVRWLSANPAEGFATQSRTSVNYVRPIRYFN